MAPPYFYEVENSERASGNLSDDGYAPRAHMHFECYRDVIKDLYEEEIGPMMTQGHEGDDATRLVFNKDRQCDKWHPYTRGFSPEKHLEEWRMLDLELKRQQFEHDMENDRKGFELSLSKMNQDLITRHESSNRRVAWTIGIIGIALAFVQLAYPNGWPLLMKLLGTLPTPSPPSPMPPM